MEEHKSQKCKEETKTHFEKISSHYSNSYAGKYTAPMHDALIQELDGKTFATILDVGCGIGTFLSMVSNKFDVEVSGIDISPGMIEKSRELLGERADLKVGDSEHLPWNDESFDIVTCIASFHHYPNPEPVLREMKRVLKHGGSLMIADPWAPNPWRFLANLIARTRLNRGGDIKVYSQKEMQELLKECGFASMRWKVRGKLWKTYFIITALAIG
jgi:ubiquinone/menaquinone biosynthesis C-methylase UbiE